jgi:hypothetical protein
MFFPSTKLEVNDISIQSPHYPYYTIKLYSERGLSKYINLFMINVGYISFGGTVLEGFGTSIDAWLELSMDLNLVFPFFSYFTDSKF